MRAADEAYLVGPAAAKESYLRGDRILETARRSGAQAIHPGYGFLSENEDFAAACERAGVVFVGPPAAAIRAMGSKSAAKAIMEMAGVPLVPGYHGDEQDAKYLQGQADRIGYPVLIKASAGGGGKGMRIVERADDFAAALASCKREAAAAFGDDKVLVEKYLRRPRHIEIQVFADTRGNCVYLFERDCSVQRRHQKVIEEAPAPRLPDAVRARLHAIGVNAGKAVDYRGAGTVECLYDGRDGVWFMEMNTRLQVEHPVTEEITGVDLVELQLRVAAGEGLALEQADIREQGHAFEARLYAENPDNGFAPSTGALTTLRLPAGPRADSGVEEGQEITPFYDPMIAKIIRHGRTREEALARLRGALAEIRVAGLETNARFLHRLAADVDFIKGDVSTRYIAEHEATLFAKRIDDTRVLAAALADLVLGAPASPDPWESLSGFRLNKPGKWAFWIAIEGEAAIARVFRTDGGFEAEIDRAATAAGRRKRADAPPSAPAPADGARRFRFAAERIGADIRLTIDEETFLATVVPNGTRSRVFIGAEFADVDHPDVLSGAMGGHSAEGSLNAPMPGVVTLLKAKPGERVAAGAVLLVMEAMKMEHAIKAPHDGVVKAFRAKAGDQVKDGALLVEFEET